MKRKSPIAAVVLAGVCLQPQAHAQLTAVSKASFPTGTGPISFASLARRTEVNNLTFHGLNFHVLVSGVSRDGLVKINTGPGASNDIGGLSATGGNDSTLSLVVNLPAPVTDFGYGYTDLSTSSLADGTTMTPFDGAASLGTLTFGAVPDPTNAGGFAGIHSDVPFDKVSLTFSPSAFQFAADNFQFSPGVAVETPEPGSAAVVAALLLVGSAVTFRRRRKCRCNVSGP